MSIEFPQTGILKNSMQISSHERKSFHFQTKILGRLQTITFYYYYLNNSIITMKDGDLNRKHLQCKYQEVLVDM